MEEDDGMYSDGQGLDEDFVGDEAVDGGDDEGEEYNITEV
jgi:hypothetical protein